MITLKKKNFDPDRFRVDEMIGSISESSKSSWGKYVFRGAMDDNPSSVQIRNMDFEKPRIGKGISLSDKEVDDLTDLLVESGYGNSNKLEKAVKKRKKMYGFSDDLDYDAPLSFDLG